MKNNNYLYFYVILEFYDVFNILIEVVCDIQIMHNN